MKRFLLTSLALLLTVVTMLGCSLEEVSPMNASTTPEKMDAQSVGSEKLEVHYIDVGQGDSTLIKTPDSRYILIDGGDNHKGDTVVDYLKKTGVQELDAVIATHPDADHIGGLDTVINAIPVKSVYAPKVSHTTQTYKDFLLAVKNRNLKIKSAKGGLELPSDGLKASFIAPVGEYGKDLNAWSAVLRVTYKDTTFLFTGDAESKSEADMLSSGSFLKADVLKVGHHGSDTSTSMEFLNAVKPRYAVISAGKDNKYGHPKQTILNRLKKANAAVYRTDKQGTIIATSDGASISFRTEK